ncbi:MAG: hypothetical protein A2958_01370 [Candidatus Levybacteria bacterium RIFCSPLOWO2_01_FULL_38_13]|nr:MAG: hypothetical protein A2629_01230 [Candidatus Levybacteria bacterium RIFCSPHIGHO2_01_FULL_41_15]OGH35800.1 MAG: hypothetical protein A2958_01370 [Candidatus Levybacteria bacterium RIFCSPLOWO2_01_FULL_38_13]
MKVVEKKISILEIKRMAKRMFGILVKAVIDVKKEIMVINAELHADEEQYLLQRGSKQEDLWGINLYPEKKGDDFIEFDSMINLKPSQDNYSRGVDDPKIQKKIIQIINKLVQR